jgi:hypothetical protein
VICFTERGRDSDFCPGATPAVGPAGDCKFKNEAANCTADFTAGVGASDSREFNGGTYVWSGFDYADGNTYAVDATGMLADRVGFEKPLQSWFRSWWLSNISVMDAGRPVLWAEARNLTGMTDVDTNRTLSGAAGTTDATSVTISIVDSWIAPPAARGNNTRSIHVYTNAPWVQLYVNSEPVSDKPVPVPFFGTATFAAVPFKAGNLTAAALDQTGAIVARQTVFTGGAAAGIKLALDAPSPITGTGSHLVADGQVRPIEAVKDCLHDRFLMRV